MLNPLEMTGRTVLVTGASSGIGRETAILLSRLGATIVLAGRDAPRLEQTAAQLEGSGHVVAPFDLKDLDAIPGWTKDLAKGAGPLHGLVHCAGIQHHRPLRYLDAREFFDEVDVNLNAAIFLAKGFRQKGVSVGGSIVFLSSVSGLRATPSLCAYSATKGGILALTRTLALELARDGIRVNCVAPAVVETEMVKKGQEKLTPDQWAALHASHPLGLGQPIDVGYAIAFLLADTARWITGTTLVVDGGYSAH